MRQILQIFCISMGVTTFAPASAQPVPEVLAGIKMCRTLEDDTQRLKCFDRLVPERPSDQSAPKKSEIEFAWTIEEGRSPLDDSPEVSGILLGANGETALVLRCREKKTEAMFNPGRYLWSDSVRVLAKIGDGKVIETKWNISTSSRAVFAPSAVQFIQALPENGKLILRAIDFNGNHRDGEFRLGNVSAIRDKIAVACNWPDRPKR